jgi:hypothetical protein
MIEIQYDSTNLESFSFSFVKSDYIPPSFNIKFPDHPELEFYKAIMDKHPKVLYVSTEKEEYSTYYNYSIDGKMFTIVCDEDYDYVYFLTAQKDRKAISEYICNIIERHHAQSHYDI